MKNILVVGPHTDDGELGCGGFIAKKKEQGSRITYLVLSSCCNSVPEGMPKDILKIEVRQAVKALGLEEKDLILMDYEVRTFPQHRQAILDDLIAIKEKLNPDLVICPSINDVHQDHSTVCHEVIRAYKTVSILCYEAPWNNINFETNAFVILDERHIEKKVEALKLYKSQIDRMYCNERAIRALAVTRGIQIKQPYAEAFEVIRWVGL